MQRCLKFMNTHQPIQLLRNMSSAQLPRLPVPQLNDTLNKCLRTIKPLVSDEQFKKTETVFKKFGEPNGEGARLQDLLQKRAEKEENWLAEWWLNDAYLEFRAPLPVNSSPGLVMPQQQFKSQQDQLRFAAQLILAVLDFKSLIDKNQLKVEMMGKDPLDMSQYKNVYGTCRIPVISRDELVYHPTSKHIIIMFKNNIFKLDVVKEDDSLYSEKQLYTSLAACISKGSKVAPKVGLLTLDNRDDWSKAYKVLSQDGENVKVLKAIGSALFVLCLDQPIDSSRYNNYWTATSVLSLWGCEPNTNSANRWFDKTIQIFVSEDGRTGITCEHTPAEGQPIASIVDHIIDYIKSRKYAEVAGDKDTLIVTPLAFNVNEEVEKAIAHAENTLRDLTANLDVYGFTFEEFGKEVIKSFKLSPDSFVQMAIQWAFYQDQKVPGAHYETASTRKFLHGRTETIRSCSLESKEFCETMENSDANPQQKLQAFLKAMRSHKDYVLQAVNGLGVDRHMLGLRRIALSNNIPEPSIFSDPGWLKSKHFRLSTSQVTCKSEGLMIYGPLVRDGYACCYNLRSDSIMFGTSGYASPEISALVFGERLRKCFSQLEQLLRKTPIAKL